MSGSQKLSDKKRILKIAGARGRSNKIPKERFNEDAESVAKSIREDLSQKLKCNLLQNTLANDYNKSIVSGQKSRTSKL